MLGDIDLSAHNEGEMDGVEGCGHTPPEKDPYETKSSDLSGSSGTESDREGGRRSSSSSSSSAQKKPHPFPFVQRVRSAWQRNLRQRRCNSRAQVEACIRRFSTESAGFQDEVA